LLQLFLQRFASLATVTSDNHSESFQFGSPSGEPGAEEDQTKFGGISVDPTPRQLWHSISPPRPATRFGLNAMISSTLHCGDNHPHRLLLVLRKLGEMVVEM
jgi:hypothetical protein